MKRAAPIAGFVSTAVLTSDDGLFGKNTQETRIADEPAPKETSSGEEYKPLYERLQEQKQQKDDEWKEKNNPFAPPKALDEEEIDFIRDLESKQLESQKQQKAQAESDLALFISARESGKQQESMASIVPSEDKLRKLLKQGEAKNRATSTATSVCIVRKKRKPQSDTVPSKRNPPKRQKDDGEPQPKAKSGATALGLVAYSSDTGSEAE